MTRASACPPTSGRLCRVRRGGEPAGPSGAPARTVRSPAMSVAAMCAVVMIVGGCSTTVAGSGSADSAQVSQYRAEQSASAAAGRHELTLALCRQAMSSMVVMVHGYNTFVDRLNEVQSYDRVGDLDERARASLIAGVDQIRAKTNPSVPAAVTDPVNAFLDSSARLGEAIGRRERAGLNPLADTWTQDKQAVLAACATYLPTPPGLASTTATAPVPG
ncbi:hypothetical protein ACLQ3C_03765 [Gordonia sp. DT30]|uniref:hypothetical protein n=1 Tax=unclassified Gordonia (in: high G+C Gram-positive bacteria) TaxID=2657482 RepID=UPI003CFB380D